MIWILSTAMGLYIGLLVAGVDIHLLSILLNIMFYAMFFKYERERYG